LGICDSSKYIRVFLILILGLAVNAGGQKPAHNKGGNDHSRYPARPAETENLVNVARGLPAEFAADALIRIARSPRTKNPEWKREILDEAFRLTSDVQQPIKRRVVPLPGIPVDTRSGYLSYAFDLKLDALSLRSRIINAMLEVDKSRAQELLAEIPQKLAIHSLKCEDALVYDLSDYYEMLAQVALTTFNDGEIQQGVRVNFLIPYLEAISSPSQIAPAAKLLLSIKGSSPELRILGQSFIVALKQTSLDDRSFSDSITREPTIRRVYELARATGQQEVPYDELIKAFRSYLIKHLTAERCIENAITSRHRLPQYIRDANLLFADRPLSIDEVNQSRIDTSAKVNLYWTSRTAKRLFSDLKELRFSSEGEGRSTEAEKETQGWQEKLTEFLSGLEQWDRAEENSELDYLHQKNNLYQALIESIPEGPTRDLVLRKYVSDLAEQSMAKQSRIEWFLHANDLIRMTRASNPKERFRILQALSGSKNPTLRLYADLVRLQL
jgi:hypothetical protein